MTAKVLIKGVKSTNLVQGVNICTIVDEKKSHFRILKLRSGMEQTAFLKRL